MIINYTTKMHKVLSFAKENGFITEWHVALRFTQAGPRLRVTDRSLAMARAYLNSLVDKRLLMFHESEYRLTRRGMDAWHIQRNASEPLREIVVT